ncbi:ATP-binding protein [Bacteriovorax sp. Seq25_V]|uniref:sensor histidine kinase n=1 Tax=Bacteriovorax sp. Seq25_V TaxID=1201288 RepID=UPI0018DF731C|nr:ATP-binding protein [Bacteriovorax sp. Seq25_V]
MLLKYILITSSFFTFISTLVQVYIDYKGDYNSIQKTIIQVESSYSSSLANSLWHLDNDQIDVLLTGILKLRDIEYIKVVESKNNGDAIFMEKGNNQFTRKIEHRFDLSYGKKNQSTIGYVVVSANLDYLYDRILDKIFIVLVTQTIKTFLVSFIILFIIYVTIAKKIILISKYAEDLTHKNIDQELVINKSAIDENNEIFDLIISLNRMRLNLKNYIKNRDDAESQLKDYKSHLEDLVLKRTKQLNDKNSILEQKIDEINKMQDHMIAQEKLASLGNLTSGIAHEINNPLNFVINFAQVSDESLKDVLTKVNDMEASETAKSEIIDDINDIEKMVSEISSHGKRAEQIVKSMLAHSRAGNENNIKEKADIHNILDENLNFAFHAMRAKYKGFHINIIKNFDDKIGEIEVISADIARVFLNLFSNSFYSMLKKSEKFNDKSYIPELNITTRKDGSNINIVVHDNGMGLDKETIEKVFTPFFTTKPTGEGTGLGLSLSYDIITGLHGGKISVDGKIGDFAEFSITLPA